MSEEQGGRSGSSISTISNVDPRVQQAIKDAISSMFSELSANLSFVIDSRFSDLKHNFSKEQEASLSSQSKQSKKSEPELNSKHIVYLISLKKAKDSLASTQYKKAKEAIKEGITLLKKHIKVIKLADRSEFGWSTVKQYLLNELASNKDLNSEQFTR